MPELPEVETIVRTLRPQVVNRRIAGVRTLLPKTVQAGASLLERAAPGMAITGVFRRAKLLVLELHREPASPPLPETLFLVFHLKMTGRFFVHPADAEPLRHTRLILDLAAAAGDDAAPPAPEARLFFDDMRTFGYCRAVLPQDLPHWPFWAALGPEPLDTPAKDLAARFAAHKAGIKAVLLDQEVVAGVGNIYADESLFQAGVHPLAKAHAVAPKRLLALAEALQTVLAKSIEECGSSIRDYRDAQGNAGAFQNCFAVYGRKGQPCVRCGEVLQGLKAAGRSTVFCGNCQT